MVYVLIKSDSRYELNRDALRKAVYETLEKQRISGNIEVSISVVGDRKMRLLNNKFREINETTDVLSFPFEDHDRLAEKSNVPFVNSPDNVQRLGDIVISYPQAVKQAAEEGLMVDAELAKLTEHGIMHILGFDHDELGRFFFPTRS